MNSQEIWEAVLAEIKLNLSKANFLTWFKDTTLLEVKDEVAIISVPSNFVKEWLEKKYHKTILNLLNKLSPEIKNVQYVISSSKKPLLKTAQKVKTFLPSNDQMLIQTTINPETNLNLKYTFENFVVGSNNELAHAAALAVTENLGKKYNPLFIYGGVGLGKTHLLHAIGNYLKEHQKKFKIRYLTTEKFTEDLVSSILNNTVENFKKTFKSIDLLLLDDIQFITHKDKTQEILFSIFNTLYEKNKQIVFSSDRPPKAIPYLEERLRSRFEGGMTVDIGSPDFETRNYRNNCCQCSEKRQRVRRSSK